MVAIDWKARAKLHHGSGGDGAGRDPVREGTAGELAHHVAELSAEKRAGMVLEVEGGRSLQVDEILELAARGDLRE